MSQRRAVATTQVLLRGAVLGAVLAALGCTRVAGSSEPWLELVIIGLAPLCAWSPASHGPALLTGIIGLHWVIAVDNVGTVWAAGAGTSIAVVHLATAAASTTPLAAGWTSAMLVRWGRRFGLLAAVTIATWLLVALAERADIGSSSVLVTVALLSISLALLWVNGRLTPESQH